MNAAPALIGVRYLTSSAGIYAVGSRPGGLRRFYARPSRQLEKWELLRLSIELLHWANSEYLVLADGNVPRIRTALCAKVSEFNRVGSLEHLEKQIS